MAGPLEGIRVIEMAGLAPAPYAGMILSDFGADVIRVDRAPASNKHFDPTRDYLARGKRSVAVNLKDSEGIEAVFKLLESSDVLLEPFRPGVMEKLGLGPDVVAKRNPRVIYARLTGWGQDGPYGSMAGHDINYIAISGMLNIIGRKGGKPTPPVNLLGDFAGGGMLCAMGIVMALLERTQSGVGQVIDAAMVDGASHLGSFLFGFNAGGLWNTGLGNNMLDTGAPFYDTYETSDGKFMAVGAIEPQFYAELLRGLELDAEEMPNQYNREHWSATAEKFSALFKAKTRDEWTTIFDGTDACVAPILGMDEAPNHPHNIARQTFAKRVNNAYQPEPAPRLSRTPGQAQSTAPLPGENTDEVFASVGMSTDTVAQLKQQGALD